MKKEIVLYLFLSVVTISCSSGKQSPMELPYIDAAKDYPEKEISLTDIANVTYVRLNTDSAGFIYKGTINYVTQNTIVVTDRVSNSVLFFSKEGNPKSRFNRRGPGPEEYTDAAYVIYDEAADEVYVSPDFSDYINVYSSSGEYKRKLTLPQRNINGQMAFFDEQSILVYDNTNLWQSIVNTYSNENTAFTKQSADSSFYLISGTDGAVLEYINLPPRNNIDLSFRVQGGGFGQTGYARIRKSPDGLFLYNPENDTIFLYCKDKSLTPFMHKKPLLRDSSPMAVMDICMDAGGFLFMSLSFYQENDSPSETYYMRDKETGEIFRQKFILPDDFVATIKNRKRFIDLSLYLHNKKQIHAYPVNKPSQK